jgi:hypothetical protein
MDGPVGATDTSNGAWFMKHSMLECATVLGAITHEFLLVQEGGSNAWGKKVELDGLDRSPLFGRSPRFEGGADERVLQYDDPLNWGERWGGLRGKNFDVNMCLL